MVLRRFCPLHDQFFTMTAGPSALFSLDLQPGNLDSTCSESKSAPAGPCESPNHEVSEAAARGLDVDIMNPAD